jgi:Lrp/AsnC family leucine-responsive transcriptional regulator
MPFELDNYDIAILKVLMKDGRKSFRQISRETGITTPTAVVLDVCQVINKNMQEE